MDNDDEYNADMDSEFIPDYDDDNDISKVVREDPLQWQKLRVIKLSLSSLVKIRNTTLKKLFINTFLKFVMTNTELAVRCGMIMHHVVMN